MPHGVLADPIELIQNLSSKTTWDLLCGSKLQARSSWEDEEI
jgi:hypothetical protein